MKSLVTVTKSFEGKKNPNGEVKYRFFFEDEEGYKGQAFWKDRVEVGMKMLISMRNYKGTWYPVAIEVIENGK